MHKTSLFFLRKTSILIINFLRHEKKEINKLEMKKNRNYNKKKQQNRLNE
jgi:hypothetical protein